MPARAAPAPRLLLLASASPRRADLLRQVGLAFEVDPAHVDEAVPQGTRVEEAVALLARRKADAVSARATGEAWVLAADTLGERGGVLLGKAESEDQAREMLTDLAGGTHRVLTGVCVRHLPSGRTLEAVEETAVTFAPLSSAQIDAYIATGEPLGKAAGYALQGRGGALVARIEGDPSNVVGLPLATTLWLLEQAGYPLPPHLCRTCMPLP